MRPRRLWLGLLAVIVAIALLPALELGGLARPAGQAEAAGSLGAGWSWGDDASGQLGNGPPTDGVFANAPVQVGSPLTNITAVAAGSSHALALRSNGIVLAWGSGSAGELGNGANSSSNVPVSVSNLTNIVAVAAGQSHSLALRRDGTVWAWGNDGSGQLGNGAPNDGGSSNVPVQVAGLGGSGTLGNVIAIAAGGFHSLALRSNGTVVTWGADDQGQLGNGSPNSNSNVPVAVSGLSDAIAIAGGGSHSLAIRRDSTVVAWGYDYFGQLGNGLAYDGSFADIPVQVSGLTGAVAVAAGASHSLALKSDGSVVAWGYDQFGQLGNGPDTDGLTSNVPVAVLSLTNATGIAAGNGHSVARKSDGSVVAWGRDNFGQLGNGAPNDNSYVNAPFAVSGLANVAAVAAGGNFALAIRTATNMRAWGGNPYGQFGNGGSAPETCDIGGGNTVPCANTALPVTPLPSIATVAAGERHSVALLSNGTVWAWGDDSLGQLGNGVGAPNTCTASNTPCALSPVQVSGLANIIAVAAGERHSLALRRDGTVWAWGSASASQLGNNAAAPDSCSGTPCAISPVQVSGLTGIVAIDAGGNHSLALRDNGGVAAWGEGTSGQLGNNANANSNVPVAVSGLTNATAVAAGGAHSLALKADGTVVAWGSDGNGQLGNGGANSNSNAPVAVSGLSGVIALSAGGAHSLAVKDDGTVSSWGADANGQLGNGGTATDSGSPVAIGGLSGVVAVAAGASHSLALKSDGTVVAWGAASPALLGNGGSAPNSCGGNPCALAPVAVANLVNIVALAAGNGHSLAVAHPADSTAIDSSAASATYSLNSVILNATVTSTTSSTSVGEGTVTFTVRNGANQVVGAPLTSGTVVNGAASVAFPLTGVPAGGYSINVAYNGSTNFLTSNDPTPATLTINRATTGLTVASATATYGNASVVLSATVQNTSTPNPATLTGGTITFSITGVCTSAAIPITTGAVSATVNFTCPLGSVGVGSYPISATYSGDTNFLGSNNGGTLTLNRANTTTTVTVTPPSPAFCNNSTTLSATVTSATGVSVSEGTVDFTITGPGSLGPVTGIAVIGNTASTTLPLGTAPAGTYTVVATYVPRATAPDFNGSASSATNNLTIAALNTTTTPDAATRTYGATIPLHARAVTSPATSCNVNAGSVTFAIKQGATTIATVGPVNVTTTGDADATYSGAPIAAGSYTVQAAYSGAPNYNASGGTSALTIQKAATGTTTTVVSGAYGGSATLSATVQNTSNGANLTGGTVTFVVSQGATTVCAPGAVGVPTTASSATVTATCNLGTNAPGSYTIAATYSGDANFLGSDNSAAPTTLTIGKANTTLGATNASATYGAASVNLSATLTNSSNTAALTGGTVQFVVSQGGTTVCTATDSTITGPGPVTATASCPLAGPPRAGAGSYTIAATYSGDANFNGSTGSGTLTINKANSTTAAAGASATYGEDSVLLSVDVTNASNGTDLTGGTVQFTVTQGGNTVCTVTSGAVAGAEPVTVTATCPLNGPPRAGAGSYSIAAIYSGDANFNGSTDATPGTLVIGPAASTTTVANVSGPYGGSLTLSATVTTANGVAFSGGSVTFGVVGVCTPAAVPIAASTASPATVTAACPLGTNTPGTYTLNANYSGDGNVTTSTATAGTATITRANTTTTVANATATYGAASVTLSADVANSGSAADLTGGTVQFVVTQGATTVCTVTSGAASGPSPKTVAASCPIAGPPRADAGSYTITATYAGDARFNGSTGTGTLTINPTTSTTTVPDKSATYGGGTVALSATVGGGSTNLTDGTVTLGVAGGCTSGPLAVAPGATSRTVTYDCPLAGLPAGSRAITATYTGDANFGGSSGSGTLTVAKANTTTTAAAVSAVYGGTATLSATVTSPVALTGGSVTFGVTGVCTPTAAVPTGSTSTVVTASCALGTAAVGGYPITATYSGDTNFNGSASAPGSANLTITRAAASLQVANVGISTGTASVNLSATLTNASNGAALTGGSVNFVVKQGATTYCTAADTSVSGATPVTATAACTLSPVPPSGSYTIEATFSGDANFTGSGGSGSLSVGKRATTLEVADVSVLASATQATLTATVTSTDGTPLTGGTVTLAVGGVCTSGALAVPTGAATGQVTFACPLGGVASGTYPIDGSYSGDATFAASTDAGTLAVNQPLVTLTITVSNGSVRLQATGSDVVVTASGTRQYAPGTVVTATPTPNSGFTFIGWTWDGKDAGWANPVTFTMDANHALIARFIATPSFGDVPAGRPYTTAVTQLAARGLIRGYNASSYGPDDKVQRAQMAALIARAMPSTNPPGNTLTPPACLVANSWDCENWGTTFTDRNGTDASLWRNVGTLAHYNVALGYGNGTFGPFDNVSYGQTISFITRAMIAKGYWVAQPNEAIPYTNVPAVHLADVRTFYFYTKEAFGGVPDGPTGTSPGFGNWNDPASRGWFARALWAAVNSHFSLDQVGKGGYIK